MCGIAGIYDLSGKNRIEKEVITSMTDALIHRGPDDEGFYIDRDIGLGFRRLSIIDLSTGNQPHFNEDGSLISICNGEIYNYKELRSLLMSKGHIFSTNCDVEVIVHLYEEYGFDFLNRLNGQFAFAIYDKKNRSLFLARDHVGIAPLFYTTADSIFIFASEIKAILRHPSVKKEVDLTGLDQVFTLPGLVSPRTMFKDINSLKPGHCMIIKNSRTEMREYWDLVYPVEGEYESRHESYYNDSLNDVIRKAVSYRANADVPVGFYLSGGIDSSLIAAVLHDLYPSERRHSFSIGFNDHEIDEGRYQRLMAETVDSIHHEIIFGWDDIAKRLNNAVYHAESPLKESYDTCSLALSELVNRNSIKVILTGEGADELFAGYVGYRFDSIRKEQPIGFVNAETAMENQLRDRLWGDSNFFYERDFYGFTETKSAIYSEDINSIFNEFDCLNNNLIDKEKIRKRHHIHKRSYIDFKLRISDHLLADHGDRVAYANSVEARYPFLDIGVIGAVKNIPPDLLLNGTREKYILKQTAKKYLPDRIVNREKFAFVAPGSQYLLRHNREWINDILSYEKIKREGYFNPDTVERLKDMYMADNFSINQTFDNDLLMIILTFGIFLKIFFKEDK